MAGGRRIWVALIIVVVLVFGGCPLALYLYDLRWEKRLAEKEEELRERGIALTVEEFRAQRDMPPPAENSALIFQDLVHVPEDEEATAAAQVASMLRGAADFGAKPSDGARVLMRQCLAENSETLAIIRRGAELRRGAYPLPPNPGPATLMPHLEPLRSATRLCVAEAVLMAAEGDSAGVAICLRNARRVAASLNEPVSLIEALVRIAVGSITADGIEQTLGLCEMPPDSLAMLRRELQAEDAEFSMADAWQGELALFYWPVFRDPGQAGALMGGRQSSYEVLRLIPGFLEQNAFVYLELLGGAIDACQLPLDERLSATRRLMDRIEEKAAGSRRYFLVAMLFPSVNRATESAIESHVRLRVADAALAVEQWRMEHGEWPDSLEQLVGGGLETVPEDPFSSGKLLYRRTDGGVVLYSVGPDGQDNEGRGREEMEAEAGPRTEQYDIRFRLLDPERRGAETSSFLRDLDESGIEMQTLEEAGITRDDLRTLGLTDETMRRVELFGRWVEPEQSP
ncbi:MAG: hypothetical protein R6X33_00730 [Candidatus Brocadiia bacterium]